MGFSAGVMVAGYPYKSSVWRFDTRVVRCNANGHCWSSLLDSVGFRPDGPHIPVSINGVVSAESSNVGAPCLPAGTYGGHSPSRKARGAFPRRDGCHRDWADGVSRSRG